MRNTENNYPFNFIAVVVMVALFTSIAEAQTIDIVDQDHFLKEDAVYQLPETENLNQEITLDDFKYTPQEDQESLYQGTGNKFWDKIRTTPGYSFLTSALVPGLGQSAHQNWFRAATYMAVEATAITFRVTQGSKATRRQRQYREFVDNNWSVVKYARWVVDYKNFHEGANLTYDAVAENPGDLDRGADFQNSSDWNRVDLDLLNEMEQSTPVCDSQGQCRTSTFSHVVPRFGTQQYYELSSKFFQFGPGWRDFNSNQLENIWSIDMMSDQWLQGADMARQFNNNFRTAGNMTTLIIVNHVVSAFDAFFTSKLNIQRVKASASIENGGEITLTYNF